MDNHPSDDIIDAAVYCANKSPCAKSKRGAVIYDKFGKVWSDGYNHQPRIFTCNGSEACKRLCSELCIHAEAAALRFLNTIEGGFELLHVKTINGILSTSGGPSCLQCSKVILFDGRIDGIWLFHESGWRRYDPYEFHSLTLESKGFKINVDQKL